MSISATSSPERFERVFGEFIITALNVRNAINDDFICSMVQGRGNSWKEARANFYADCRDCDIFLTSRIDQ